jgi:hypothetical protein
MNWSIWPLLKKAAYQPIGQKRNGRHPRALNCATAKVSVGSEPCYPSTTLEQSTRQMGSQATPAGLIQSATNTTIPTAIVARPAIELSAIQSRKQQQSLFQLRQPVPFHQGLPSTQMTFPRANIQPEQQGQGQEAGGTSPPGEGEFHNSLRTSRGCANNDGYFLYKPSTRDYTFRFWCNP